MKPGTMNVSRAIRNAERILLGRQASDDELDPRWQAIISVGDHVEQCPDEIWQFTRKWGAYNNADLRTAVAMCLLEHLKTPNPSLRYLRDLL